MAETAIRCNSKILVFKTSSTPTSLTPSTAEAACGWLQTHGKRPSTGLGAPTLYLDIRQAWGQTFNSESPRYISLHLVFDLPLPCGMAKPANAPRFAASGGQRSDATRRNSHPPPPEIDPATGLPISAADQREKEIDKYDPLKPDPTAKDPNPPTDRKQPDPDQNPTEKKPPPAPGSVAESNADAASSSQFGTGGGKGAADNSDSYTADYSGPAVLSRSYTLARPMIERQLKFVPVFGITYAWDDGQAPGVYTGSADYVPTTSSSIIATWGITGRHYWKRDQIGISYAGNYSQYSINGLSGMNNTLNLDYGRAFTRQLSFHLVESVQDLSQNYTLGNPALEPGSSIANINLATSPNVQLLNSTARQSSTSASVTYHQTSRLSYNFSGSYFIIGRTGVGVIGSIGKQAGADANYRLTRRSTVGAYYSYTMYDYSHNVSHANSHGLGMIYSYSINSRTQLRTRVGATRIETLGYATVELPPTLAAILGQSSTTLTLTG